MVSTISSSLYDGGSKSCSGYLHIQWVHSEGNLLPGRGKKKSPASNQLSGAADDEPR